MVSLMSESIRCPATSQLHAVAPLNEYASNDQQYPWLHCLDFISFDSSCNISKTTRPDFCYFVFMVGNLFGMCQLDSPKALRGAKNVKYVQKIVDNGWMNQLQHIGNYHFSCILTVTYSSCKYSPISYLCERYVEARHLEYHGDSLI